ncbi:MAG: HAMP domain-containing histidine kinase [Anaerolineales bacterium]|nr:HAMP domain-containing histidine kinase [Anaerolineales bacterium]MCW5856122.1 HAMP domain-containing histidine kinase [Anaerolineales bacterium]
MEFSWPSIAALLESPLASTVYVLLALLLLTGSSLWLQSHREQVFSAGAGRAFGWLMALRLLQAVVSATAWWGEPTAAWALPALERGVQLISLVALAWLWARQPRSRWLAVGLLAAVAVAGGLMASWMNAPEGARFNYSGLDYIWSAASLLALAVAAALVWRQEKRAGLGIVVLLTLGQVLHMLLAEPFGNMPFITQAAHLLSLLALSRLPAPAATPAPQGLVLEPSPEIEEYIPEGFELPPVPEEPASLAAAPLNLEDLARQVAEAYKADLCVFAQTNTEDSYLELVSGYNLLRDQATQPADLPLVEMPLLTDALLNSKPLTLSVDTDSEELTALSQALRLSFPAFLMAQPLAGLLDAKPWTALLLNLTSAWQPEDERALQSDAGELADRLAESLQHYGLRAASPAVELLPAPASEEVETLLSQLENLSHENERYRQDVQRLLTHIDELQNEGVQEDAQALHSNELVAALQQENETLKQSLAANRSTLEAQSDDTPETRQAREELRLALQEIAALHEELAHAQQTTLLPAGLPAQPINAKQMEVIASIAQELRQPLSSVVGYTDLLLGESVGILGALQRKFLERVRHSTERMNTLIDNLIHIAELDEGGYSTQRKPVELGSVIDDAISQMRPRLQEKQIALRVDLPDQLPELNTDRDALQQILYHLLQNADAATPSGGEITLRALVDSQVELGDFALLQVSDSGGGIPEEELPRVFSRVYRASNPVIPGVGDTGVGLTIAETLTQALGGRIWVETESGVGATFSILLPLNPQANA